MTQTFKLEDQEVKRLLTVLKRNVGAVDKTDSIRWTNASASKIDGVRKSIEEQTQ